MGAHIKPAVAHEAPDLFVQLGHITRQLHDALERLGVMPRLQSAAQGLPDARGRLEYIATKTGLAAERVLGLVDDARDERRALAATLDALALDARAAGCDAVAQATLDRTQPHLHRVDAMLTEIMLAQDFHDLTGQVVRQVVAMAAELEHSLVSLLVQAAPAQLAAPGAATRLEGPVITAEGRKDVAANQAEVDELLSSLGF